MTTDDIRPAPQEAARTALELRRLVFATRPIVKAGNRAAIDEHLTDLEELADAARAVVALLGGEGTVEPLPDGACGAMGLCVLDKGHEPKDQHQTTVDRAAALDASHGYLVFEGPNGELMRTPYRAVPRIPSCSCELTNMGSGADPLCPVHGLRITAPQDDREAEVAVVFRDALDRDVERLRAAIADVTGSPTRALWPSQIAALAARLTQADFDAHAAPQDDREAEPWIGPNGEGRPSMADDREAEIARIAAVLHEAGIGCRIRHDTPPPIWHSNDASALYDAGLRSTPESPEPTEVAPSIDVERLARAVSNVEWAYMRSEGRFPAPSVEAYEHGLRDQLGAMTQQELQARPMSNPKIAAEYTRLAVKE